MKAIRVMALKPARAHGARPAARKRQAPAFVRLHEFDADLVAFFPCHLAFVCRRAGRDCLPNSDMTYLHGPKHAAEILVADRKNLNDLTPKAVSSCRPRRTAAKQIDRSTWMKEQRNQKDDRQRKAGQQKKSLFQRPHPALPPGSNPPMRVWFQAACGACALRAGCSASGMRRVAGQRTTKTSVALARDNVLCGITPVVTRA